MCAPVLLRFGTEAQKQRFLPRIYRGEDFWCQGYSEPGSGSDLASLKTRAAREGDHYVVTGQKIWTTLAQHADWIFCLVRTDPSRDKRQEGISFLLIDMHSPGITVRPIILMDGGHEVNEVFFDEVRVPAENLVHEEGKGWTVAKYLLGYERMGTGRIGQSKRELARLKTLAADHVKDGKPLLDDPRFRDRLTRVEVELMALEITNLRFLDQMRRSGRPPGADVSMLKIKGTEIQQAISELMMQAAGPLAQAFRPVDAMDFDHFTATLAPRYCNLRKATIYAGSNEIQRNIIAKMTLGLAGGETDRFMNFELSEEQQLLADTLRRYLASDYSFEARARIVDSPSGWSPPHWKAFAEMGLLGLPFPEEHGGFGGTAVDVMIAMEAFGEALVVEPYLANVGLAGQLVLRGGSEAQRKLVLPALVDGTRRLAFAHTERGARYSLHCVSTRAKRAGAGFRLEGEKRVVLGGGAADALLVSARTAGADTDPAGISLFLVDRGAPGLTLKEYRTIDELRAADVWLSDVAVPASALVGGEGAAHALVEEATDYATALLCAEAVGAIRSANDATLEYLKNRRQFGVPIGTFQALQHRMVDMVISCRAGALDGRPRLRQGGRRGRRGAAARGLGGEDQDRRRLSPREPGGRAAPRRHGDDGGAQGQSHLPTADHDRPDVRRRRAPPRPLRRRRLTRLARRGATSARHGPRPKVHEPTIHCPPRCRHSRARSASRASQACWAASRSPGAHPRRSPTRRPSAIRRMPPIAFTFLDGGLVRGGLEERVDAREVPAAQPMGRGQPVDLLRGRRHEEGDPQAPGGVHGEAEVLAHQVGHEPRLVASGRGRSGDQTGHRVHVLHEPGVAGRLRDHLGDDARVHPEALGDPERLGHRDGGHARDEVVAELGDLAAAQRPDVDHVGAHGLERGEGLLEVRGRPAHHDGERAVGRARNAARDGRVDEPDAARGRGGSHAARHRGVDGGHVHAERALARGGQDPAVSGIHGLDLRGRRAAWSRRGRRR